MLAEVSGSKGPSLRGDRHARHERNEEVWKGVLAGAVGGLAGTVVMTQLQQRAKPLFDRLRGGDYRRLKR